MLLLPRRVVAILMLSFLGYAGCSKPAVGKSCKGGAVPRCTSPAAMLACGSGVWNAIACAGPKGCEMHGESATCDESIASAGTGCLPDHTACSKDHQSALACKAGHWVASSCKGVGKCVTFKNESQCKGVAKEGSKCMVGIADSACSPDRRAVLTCDHGAFRVAMKCATNGHCISTEFGAGCSRPAK